MARLFDAYLMIDWSANSKPTTGENSVWIGLLKRNVRFQLAFTATNPPTRAQAEAELGGILDDLMRRNERVLIGVDFALGFPAGTAAQLKLKDAPWKAMQAFLASNVVDKPNNTNNRFAVAAKMNRLMTDEARPFWGAPKADTQRWLASVKHSQFAAAGAAEFRIAEQRARSPAGGPKSIWQMHGAGAVGGQTLLGIPLVRRLAARIGEGARIWPFETGWKTLSAADLDGVRAVFCEVWPSMHPLKPGPREVKDCAQVRAAAEHFAALDEADRLAEMFGPRAAHKDVAGEIVEAEEGWILGV